MKDENGQTLINRAFYILASRNTNIDTLQYLISKGADVNAKHANGSTILNAAFYIVVCTPECDIDVLKRMFHPIHPQFFSQVLFHQ